MYSIKNIILKMKSIADLNSNVELAKVLDVSYNTFNTWIKRGKIPQEVFYLFCTKYKCSFDYILNDTIPVKINSGNLFDTNVAAPLEKKTEADVVDFIYYGVFEDLDVCFRNRLKLHPTLLISNGYYLIKKESIYAIAQVVIDIFEKKVYLKIDKTTHTTSYENFKKINIGLITEILK